MIRPSVDPHQKTCAIINNQYTKLIAVAQVYCYIVVVYSVVATYTAEAEG